MWWTDWMSAEPANRGEVRKLRAAWGATLRTYPWAYFLTLTCESERSRDVLERMVREYLARLEGALGKRWWWAYAVEGGTDIRPNVHLLLGGLPKSGRSQAKITDAWGRRGRVELVDAADRPNAEAYLVKALELDYEHIDIAPAILRKVAAWNQRERHRAQVSRHCGSGR